MDKADPSSSPLASGASVGPSAGVCAQIRMDPLGYITGWDAEACDLFGYNPEEALGQHILFLYADNSAQVSELFLEPGTDLIEVDRRAKSGQLVRVGLRLHVEADAQGRTEALVAHFSRASPALTNTDKMRLYVRIIEDTHQGVLVTDMDERIVMVNSAFTRITGYTAGEAIGQTPDLLRSGKHDDDFRAQVRSAMRGAGLWFGEILGRRKNGEIFPQSVSISAIRNDAGEVTHAFSIFSDISGHKETEARLQRLANFDPVTALPNRSLLNQLLGQALSMARRGHEHGAVLVVQLHRLGALYDTLGLDAGDQFMAQVAQNMRLALREQDILARLGHDKLVVCVLNSPKRENAALVAHKLLATLAQPVQLDHHEVKTDASVGIALYPDNGFDTAALLRCAELATARAAESGEPTPVFFSDEMNHRANERFRVESELRHALQHGELRLYHQPKVSLRSGRIVGAEALLRWQHPQHGLLAPGRFVPVAEETHLILEVGEWALREACRQIRDWKERQLRMPPLAVNLSARQFDRHLPRRLEALLDEYGIEPQRLKLEITESLVVRGADQVVPIMNELVAMGLSIALDDFGTGYSSLAYLKRFPIDTLKIDRSFVIGIPDEPNDCAIAQAIVTMGQQLRQEIVAEGVETREQMAFLRRLGCDQLQGYLFSPPLPAADYERLVADGVRLDLGAT